MNRLAIAFVFLPLFAFSSASVSAGTKDESDRKSDFFAPRPGFFDPRRDSSSDETRQSMGTPNLFRQIGKDFRDVFTTRENLIIVGAGLGAALAASPYDERLSLSRFNSELFENTQLDSVFESGEIAGGALAQVGGAFAAFGIGKLIDNPDVESLGRDLVRAQILTQSITQVIKLSVGRTRPDESGHQSFPSGHASGTFATATVLQRRYGWKIGVPAYGFAAYVAASRLSENKHYLSDVIFGAAIGILCGRTVTIGRGRMRFALSPTIPAGGGFGIQAAWLSQNE